MTGWKPGAARAAAGGVLAALAIGAYVVAGSEPWVAVLIGIAAMGLIIDALMEANGSPGSWFPPPPREFEIDWDALKRSGGGHQPKPGTEPVPPPAGGSSSTRRLLDSVETADAQERYRTELRRMAEELDRHRELLEEWRRPGIVIERDTKAKPPEDRP